MEKINLKDKSKWLVLITVAVGTFMAPLDASVVNIALPVLTKYFNVNLQTIGWVVLSYLLAVSTLLLSFGRLGDMIGHRKVYIMGFIVFVFGSILCGISKTVIQLIIFRAFQGVGAGMIMAVGPAIVTSAFPPTERGKALGIISTSVAAALTLGPTLGGFLVSNIGWRWIFFINIPVGIIATLLSFAFLSTHEKLHEEKFDVIGAFFAFIFLISLLSVLSKGDDWGWLSINSLILMIVFVIFLGLFIYTEKKADFPMVDLSLFNNRLFTSANVSALVSYMSIFTVTFLMPFYLMKVLGFTPAKAGIFVTPVPLAMWITSPVSGWLSDRIGSRLLSTTGMVLLTIGLLAISRLNGDPSTLQLVIPLLITGTGLGIFQSPNSSAIMGSVPRNRLGIASGITATVRNIGMILGIAFSGTIVAIRTSYYLPVLKTSISSAILNKTVLLYSIRDAFLASTIICTVGVFASLIRGKHKI